MGKNCAKLKFTKYRIQSEIHFEKRNVVLSALSPSWLYHNKQPNHCKLKKYLILAKCRKHKFLCKPQESFLVQFRINSQMYYISIQHTQVNDSTSSSSKRLVRFYRTIMKSYGSTFVTFPSHLAQREESCQKSLHQRQNTHLPTNVLLVWYWA